MGDIRVGVTIFLTDQTIDIVELAREVESRGFDSLYIPEHTHIPTSRRTPPPTGEAELPEMYKRSLDPLVALGACAAVTETLVVGTGIALVAQHDPITYAKEWATLDYVSGGRAVFGVGFGWNEDEMEHHGVAYATRRAQAREHVLAMYRLWEDDEASFDGEYVKFSPSWSWPKPLQRPHPTTLIGGGGGPVLFEHVAEWADGWMPIGGAGLSDMVPTLQQAWTEAGRDGSPIVVPFGVLPTPGKLEHYRELGCSETVLRVPSASRDEVLPVLDSFAEYVA